MWKQISLPNSCDTNIPLIKHSGCVLNLNTHLKYVSGYPVSF